VKAKLTIALFLFGLSSFLTQNLTAALAIAVASNGKWAIAHDNSLSSVAAVSAEAIQKCKARGGADARVAGTFFKAANGAVAVSDNGTGKIVGFSFSLPGHRQVNVTNSKGEQERAAISDCKKKGGQNPKVVTSW
jgi:Domain of unknown function (DUF4189)